MFIPCSDGERGQVYDNLPAFAKQIRTPLAARSSKCERGEKRLDWARILTSRVRCKPAPRRAGQPHNVKNGGREVRSQGGPEAVAQFPAVFQALWCFGPSIPQVPLDAAHVGHRCRSHDQAGDAEQAAYGQLARWKGMLDRAHSGLHGGTRIATSVVAGAAAPVAL